MKIEPLFRVLSGFLSVGKHNANADRIENAFDNTLSRDGSAPNAMQAELDMGLNRIVNVAKPTDLNDAVRLQDVQDIVAGDFTVSSDWADITGKPTEFTPADHTHTASEVTDFQEAVEDVVGSAIVAGSNITVTYNDTTGRTTVEATGASAADWNTLVNKPADFTPSTHTHAQADVTGLTTALSGKANTTHTHVLADITDYTSGGGFTTMPNFVDVFGGNPDSSTSNDTAFTNAEASTYERIWLPEGTYFTTKPNSFFNKWYEGPGKIILNSGAGLLPGKKSLTTTPAFGSITTEYGESGDTKFTNIGYEYIRNSSRENIYENHYFQAGACGTFKRFFSLSGSSGTNAHLTAAANAGTTSATLNSAEGLTIGDVIGFQLSDNATPGDIVTITNIVGNVITFTPALANTYPFAGSDWAVPQYVSGYSTSSQVSKGRRTNNVHYMATLDATAGGDHYLFLGRVANSYVPKAGQTDFFDTATVAFIGGDMDLTQDGQYGTPWEFAVNDNGKDVAVINVSTYNRTNDTGARRVTWVHDLPKSEGTKPIDVFYCPNGKSRVGLDLTLADFSSDGERAIQMKSGQRIYFDSAATGAVGTRARGFWGNVQGNSYITHGTDSTEYVDLYVGGTRAMKFRTTSLNTSLQLNISNSINATGSVSIGTGQAVYLNGLGGNTYLAFDGSTIYLFKNGVQVATW